MKLLKFAGILFLLAIVGLFIYGLLGPKGYQINRSIEVNASSEKIFALISSFENFKKWNPWSPLDTNMKTTIKNDGQVGATYEWSGNKNVGSGSMTVTEINSPTKFSYDLRFEGFDKASQCDMQITKGDSGQKVSWNMKAEMPFPWNIFGLFMGMEKSISKDFDSGLANLKKLAEDPSSNASIIKADYKIETINWEKTNCLSVRKKIGFNEIASFFATHFPAIATLINKNGGTCKAPFGIFFKYDEVNQMTDMAAAIPFTGAEKMKSKDYEVIEIPSSKAYKIEYYGPYEKTMGAYVSMNEFLNKNFKRNDPDMVIEEYITDPMIEKDSSKWLTNIYFFVNQ